MTLEQIKGILDETELPVSYQDFPDGEAPAMPYITFEDTDSNNFHADGIVYAKVVHIEVTLWTKDKDTDSETLLENALLESGITWEKSVQLYDEEACMGTVYGFDTIGG